MVLIENLQRSTRIDIRKVKRDAQRLLRLFTIQTAELGVLLVADGRMKSLNSRYRGIEKTTDVLSFPQQDARALRAAFSLSSPLVLGDIVINLRAAGRQAPVYRNTFYGEVRRLLVHGFLHLLGYDHERNSYQARKMRKKEGELLDALAAMDKKR